MPLDGLCPPGSPLAILMEADRKLTAEQRANSLPRRNPATPEENRARQVAQALASIEVLDRLIDLFAHGEHWIRSCYEDGRGGFCLSGGLQHLRAGEKCRDRAGVYLVRAIAETVGRPTRMEDFNDALSRYGLPRDYVHIHAVIRRARELAREVAEG